MCSWDPTMIKVLYYIAEYSVTNVTVFQNEDISFNVLKETKRENKKERKRGIHTVLSTMSGSLCKDQ